MKPSHIFIFLTLLFNGGFCQNNYTNIENYPISENGAIPPVINYSGEFIPPLPVTNEFIPSGEIIPPGDRIPPLPVKPTDNVKQPPSTSSGDRIPPLPVDPRVPIKPGNPVDPRVPIKPGNPVDPRVPIKPGNPVDPRVPIKPGNPVDPRDPINPVDPRDPIKPGNPVDPRVPIKPVDPRVPIKPVDQSDQAKSDDEPRESGEPRGRSEFPDFGEKYNKYKNVSYILFDEENSVLFSKDEEINYEFKHDSKTKYVIDEYIELYDVIVSENSTVSLSGEGVINLLGALNVNGNIILSTEVTIQGIIYTSPEATLTLNNTLTSGSLNQDSFCLFDGLTNGVGTMNCTIINNGVLSPGFSPGIIHVASLVLETDSVVYMEIQDLSHDLIVSQGNVFIDGSFIIDFSGDIQPGIYTMISGEQIIGTFKSLVINGLSQYFTCNFIQSNSTFVVEITTNQINSIQPVKNNYNKYIIAGCVSGFIAGCVGVIIYKRKKNKPLKENTYSYVNPLMV